MGISIKLKSQTLREIWIHYNTNTINRVKSVYLLATCRQCTQLHCKLILLFHLQSKYVISWVCKAETRRRITMKNYAWIKLTSLGKDHDSYDTSSVRQT